MTQTSQVTGQIGEQLAQRILIRKGFRIEALNWRAGALGEIDLIGYHPQERLLVFAEVKARKTSAYGAPAEAVGKRKQLQLLKLAEIYLDQHPQANDLSIRFDVISILFPGGGRPAEISHIEDAFGENQT